VRSETVGKHRAFISLRGEEGGIESHISEPEENEPKAIASIKYGNEENAPWEAEWNTMGK